MEPKQKPGRSRQDYGTPPEFIAVVKKQLRIMEFDCDLAASAENAVASEWSESAMEMPTWRVGNGWNWLNPPFGKIGPWVERAYREAKTDGAKTAVLIPAGVGANWWRDWVHDKADVQFLNGRLTFVGCTDPYPKDCALLLYHPIAIAAGGYYSVWPWQSFVTSTEADAEIQSPEEGKAHR